MGADEFSLLLQRLDRIDAALAELRSQRVVKEFYSTDEVAEALSRAGYTVREWCRKGQARAIKSANGRGWLIPHAELTRLRNEGPLPEHQPHRVLDR